MTIENALVNYLALCAWQSKADCVVLQAQSLRRYYNLERLPDARVQALTRLARPLFPFAQRLWAQPETKTHVVLYLSRFELPKPVFEAGAMSTAKRIALLNAIMPTVQIDLPRWPAVQTSMDAAGAGESVFAGPAPIKLKRPASTRRR